jgi:chromosomal replication initiation ATPase DnaA
VTPRDPDELGIVTEALRRTQHFGRHAFLARRLPGDGARATELKIRRRQDEILAEEIEREAQKRATAVLAEIDGLEVPKLPLKLLMRLAVEITGLPSGEMLGPCRSAPVAVARHFAWWLVRNSRPDLSLPALGRIFHRDHTSIIHGLKRVRRQINKAPFAAWIADPRLQALLARGGDQ